jgi:predicted PolB exonuclease-like 3'-5' exonuclease
MIPVLAFDIETIPDTDGLKLLYDLDAQASAEEVAEIAFQRTRQSSGHDFLPLHVQRVVAIACTLREQDTFKVWSLGHAGESEAELIRRFFDGIEKYTPQLVSWNGGGFDLPVLHYRAVIHGVPAARYWDMGEEDRDFKWNNYISRYHTRHLDLMDLLALYQPRAYVPLDQMARLLGLPGKLGMEGSQVWRAYQDGKLDAIRNYCETDALNTYLVYLRFQLMRGALASQAYQRECDLVRATLAQATARHWKEFLQHWKPLPSA